MALKHPSNLVLVGIHLTGLSQHAFQDVNTCVMLDLLHGAQSFGSPFSETRES